MPLLARLAFSSVMLRSASATRGAFALKCSRTPWPGGLRLLIQRVERARELGEKVGDDLTHEARLDALDGPVARLDRQPGEAPLVGDFGIDERDAVVFDGTFLGLGDEGFSEIRHRARGPFRSPRLSTASRILRKGPVDTLRHLEDTPPASSGESARSRGGNGDGREEQEGSRQRPSQHRTPAERAPPPTRTPTGTRPRLRSGSASPSSAACGRRSRSVPACTGA